MDEYLSMYDALLYILTNPDEKVDVEFTLEVNTPAIPPPLQPVEEQEQQQS
jgi:hypothetical protein